MFVTPINAGITAGQVDDFQDGTTQNWSGAPNMLSVVGGGQGGAGDLYLQVTSVGGSGPGSRMAFKNDAQWTGDYGAAGITAMLVRGQIAYKVPPLITTLGSGSIAGVPWIVIVAALMLLLGHLVLTYTRFGRYVYMVGGNREAAAAPTEGCSIPHRLGVGLLGCC